MPGFTLSSFLLSSGIWAEPGLEEITEAWKAEVVVSGLNSSLVF
jgi:hypothetical protein